MKRALLLVLAMTGCRSTLDVDRARAYECTAGGVAQCPFGWVCGDDGHCFDPAVGLARRCSSATTGCGGGWKCGFDNLCFDPAKTDVVRGCTDPALHCPGTETTAWKCGLDRVCFDPAQPSTVDGGSRPCASTDLHCPAAERCGLDGRCFSSIRTTDAGAGPVCESDLQCAIDWRCGREASGRRLCQPIGVGGPYPCAADLDCEGWRCDPVAKTCVDVREPLEGARFPSLLERVLTPPLLPIEPPYAMSQEVNTEAPALNINSVLGTTIARFLDGGTLALTLLASDGTQLHDGGVFFVGNHFLPRGSHDVLELASGPGEVLLLTDAGVVERASFRTLNATELVATDAVAVREALNRSEVAALFRCDAGYCLKRFNEVSRVGPDAGVVDVLGTNECTGSPIVDFAYAVESRLVPGDVVRAAWLTPTAVCFSEAGGDAGAAFRVPAELAPRRFFFNFHKGPNAFADAQPAVPRRSGIREMVVEYAISADGGHSYSAHVLGDWLAGTVSTLNGVDGATRRPETCPSLCPHAQKPLEVFALPASAPGNDRSVLSRCGAFRPSPTGELLPPTTYLVNTNGADCSRWSPRQIATDDEDRPHQFETILSFTSKNRRVLASRDGHAWTPSGTDGSLLRALFLDRGLDLANRVALLTGAGEPQLFLAAGTAQFTPSPIGLIRQKDFPVEYTPLGRVAGQSSWVVTATAVLDASRFPLAAEFPFTVATAPDGIPWSLRAIASERQGTLLVASGDAVASADVSTQKVSSFVAPARMNRAFLPSPGLPIRAMAVRALDGGIEAWTITSGGAFRSATVNGLSWSTDRVSLNGRDSKAAQLWITSRGVRLLTDDGQVVSLPTNVPLAAPPPRQPAIIRSAERVCGATFALFDHGQGDAGIYRLVGASDGGASWNPITLTNRLANLATSQLRGTSIELLVVSERGEVISLVPQGVPDGGCLALEAE